jgi:hypothetical protein
MVTGIIHALSSFSDPKFVTKSDDLFLVHFVDPDLLGSETFLTDPESELAFNRINFMILTII